jgi:hypothetical protein
MTENSNRNGSAREEAERLVAAALAAASVAARGITRNSSPLAGAADLAGRLLSGGSGGHVATGSPECCVCPLCRAIAAVRDPSPETALKLAVGASDLAANLSGVLRSVSDLMGGPAGARRSPSGGEPADRHRTSADPDAVWRTATGRQAGAPGSSGERASGPLDDRPPRSSDEQAAAWVEPDDPWHAATHAPVPPSAAPESDGEPAPPDGA